MDDEDLSESEYECREKLIVLCEDIAWAYYRRYGEELIRV